MRQTLPIHPATALQEVVVTATLLRDQPIQSVPASITVLDSATLKAAGQQHFEDVLGLVPNLNWSGDTNRPRFFQIRGIGELDEYQGAPNPSVGFLIDDIDFSGIGTVGDAVRYGSHRGAARSAEHALWRQCVGRPDRHAKRGAGYPNSARVWSSVAATTTPGLMARW